MVPARPITILAVTGTDLYVAEPRVTSGTCTHLQICATRPKSFKDVPAGRGRHRLVITALITQQVSRVRRTFWCCWKSVRVRYPKVVPFWNTRIKMVFRS